MSARVFPLLVAVILVLVPAGAFSAVSCNAPCHPHALNIAIEKSTGSSGKNTGAAGNQVIRLTLFPHDNIVIYKGRLQYFEARLTDLQDRDIAGAIFRWTVSNGALGAITQTGIFIAGNSSGVCTVNVTSSAGGVAYGNSTHITIQAVHPRMTEIRLSPLNLTIKKGDSAYIRAQAYNGSLAMGGAEYGWSGAGLSGNAAATQDPQVIRFSPQQVGWCNLSATAYYNESSSVRYNMSAELGVRVVWGAQSIEITSTAYELKPDQKQEFNATAYYVAGDGANTVINGVLFHWSLESLDPAGICAIDTEYGSSTNITATDYGSGTLVASADDVSEKADFTVPVPDDTPPVISHEPVQTAQQNTLVLIRADVYDESGVGYVYLCYWGGKGDWKTVKMTRVKGEFTAYEGNISADALGAYGVDYYIEARDIYGNTAFSPDTGRSRPYHITVEVVRSFFSTPEFWLGVVGVSLILASVAAFGILRWRRKAPARKKKGQAGKTVSKSKKEKDRKTGEKRKSDGDKT